MTFCFLFLFYLCQSLSFTVLQTCRSVNLLVIRISKLVFVYITDRSATKSDCSRCCLFIELKIQFFLHNVYIIQVCILCLYCTWLNFCIYFVSFNVQIGFSVLCNNAQKKHIIK